MEDPIGHVLKKTQVKDPTLKCINHLDSFDILVLNRFEISDEFVHQLAEGLLLEKTSCPLGVLLIVFESRPDALVQVMVTHSFLYNMTNDRPG